MGDRGDGEGATESDADAGWIVPKEEWIQRSVSELSLSATAVFQSSELRRDVPGARCWGGKMSVVWICWAGHVAVGCGAATECTAARRGAERPDEMERGALIRGAVGCYVLNR